MSSPRIASLHVHPVKGCRGVALERVEIDARGPADDRRWMFVDEGGRFLTQREVPRLALVDVALAGGELRLSLAGGPPLALPAAGRAGERREVTCWRDACDAVDQGDDAARWLHDRLGVRGRLVRMADDFERRVNPARSPEPAVTGFTDGYPFLLIGAASLDDLNRRLDAPLPMNRFRPNLVVAGSEPYAEDGWRRVRIGAVPFDVVKPCPRCAVSATDQQSAVRGREPLATLARYRRLGGEVMFGQNLVHRGRGEIAVGDPVSVLERGEPPAFE